MILDGTLLPIDHIAADRPFYSGKHKKHGMNVQILTDPIGRLLWASPALPGAIHDVRAAREHGVVDALATIGIKCWADKAYRGAGGTVRTPYWGSLGDPVHRSEGRQPVPREDPRTRRAGHGHPQSLEAPPQTPSNLVTGPRNWSRLAPCPTERRPGRRGGS
ncbi:transposase family protein [Streptomyces sp. NPDC002088]|uniref:transposase family protein n=1 Tax=Streptomyces sp. NPDC002088 TaxID=3154665 RepID=UPI0033257346